MECSISTGIITQRLRSDKVWAFAVSPSGMEIPLQRSAMKFVRRMSYDTDFKRTWYDVEKKVIVKVIYIHTAFGKPIKRKEFFITISEQLPKIKVSFGKYTIFHGNGGIHGELPESFSVEHLEPKRKAKLLIKEEEQDE